MQKNRVGRQGFGQIFRIFLRLGCTSFGGPVAHLAYFHEEFVTRRRWLSEAEYVDLVALCQFLPGPASSQVGLGLGWRQGGYAGALAAWLGFTLPSALLLFACALGMVQAGLLDGAALQGLKVVAMAVVIQAVWQMGRKLCNTAATVALMLAAAALMLAVPAAWMQWLLLALAALAGYVWFDRPPAQRLPENDVPTLSGVWWLAALVLVGMLLLVLGGSAGGLWQLADIFYRTGPSVFGGGHVVLPMLQAELVPTGWVDADWFLAGYGLAQAVPGPLFTLAAFLGAASNSGAAPVWGGSVALLAMFAPSFFLVFGVLPYWQRLRTVGGVQAALRAVNAAVVGLLLAALYRPVWMETVNGVTDLAAVALAYAALVKLKLSPWLVVLAGGLLGWLWGRFVL